MIVGTKKKRNFDKDLRELELKVGRINDYVSVGGTSKQKACADGDFQGNKEDEEP